MRLQRRGGRTGLHRCDAALHRALHLLERAHFDLTHALAGDAELGGQILERDRVVRQSARLEDAALAVVEHGECIAKSFAAIVRFLAFRQTRFLVGDVVDQPVLPLAGIAILALEKGPPGDRVFAEAFKTWKQ